MLLSPSSKCIKCKSYIFSPHSAHLKSITFSRQRSKRLQNRAGLVGYLQSYISYSTLLRTMHRYNVLDLKLKLLLLLLPFVLWSLLGWPYIKGHNSDESGNIANQIPEIDARLVSEYESAMRGRTYTMSYQRRSSVHDFAALNGQCIDYFVICDVLNCADKTDVLHLGWSYLLCHRKFIKRMRVKKIVELNDTLLIDISDREIVGTFDRGDGEEELYVDSDGAKIAVSMKCCNVSSGYTDFARNLSVQFPFTEVAYRVNQIVSVNTRDSRTAQAEIIRVHNSTDGKNLHLTVCMPSLCTTQEVLQKRLGRDARQNWRLSRRQVTPKRSNMEASGKI